MKLTIILLTLALSQVSATGLSQNVTLKVVNASLETVFKSIEKQTGYGFLYTKKAVQNVGKITVDIKNVPLQAALQQCLTNQHLSFSILDDSRTIIVKKETVPIIKNIPQSTQPIAIEKVEDVDIRGIVRSDETGEPLVGATVTLKGTKVAVLTDVKGSFSIKVPKNSTLVVTYVGYVDKEVEALRSGSIEIKLSTNSKSLSETVVTGVYVRPKSSYTGASRSYTTEDIAKVGNTNIISVLKSLDPSFQVLENINAGSNPNTLANVVLRSGNSLQDISKTNNVPFDYASNVNTPLFILDGFETDLTRITDLDINRIARVDVLKDAVATSIYGSRAANGVIVIETIPPKEGKLRFTYTASASFEIPDLSSYHLLNEEEKFALENRLHAYTNDYYFFFTGEHAAYYYSDRKAAIARGVNTDWLALPLQMGIGTNHSLYLDGGTGNTLYGVNLTYNKVIGAMKGSDRLNLSGNTYVSYRVKNFQFRNDVIISSNTANNSPYGDFSVYGNLNPYWSPYDSTGQLQQFLDNVIDQQGGYRITDLDHYNNGSAGPSSGRAVNPLYNASLHTVDKSDYINITDNFSMQWQVKQWMVLRGRLGIQHRTNESDLFYPGKHGKFINTPTFQRGSYTKGYGKNNSLEGMFTSDFNKLIGENQFLATVGVNVRESKYETQSYTVIGFPNERLDDIVLGNGYPQAGLSGSKPSGTDGLDRMIGFLSNVSYSYNRRFLLDLSFRTDGSSQFGSENRFAPFWSVGTGWNLHNEAFIKKLGFVDFFKIRGSYGSTGSQNFNSYLNVNTSQYYTGTDYRGIVGTYLLGYGNSALLWQKTLKTDFGTDITLFNNKFSLTADYFIEKTQGSIATISTAPSTGFSSYSENMGDLIGRGWEVSTRYNFINNNAKRNNLSLFVNLFSTKNKIERVSNTIAALNQRADNTSSSVPITRYAPGQSTTAIWAVQSLGIDPATGYEILVRKNGSITSSYYPQDQVIVGDSRPKIQGTFGTNAEIKGIGLNLYFSFKYGGQAYNQTLIDKVENADPLITNVDRRAYDRTWAMPGDLSFFKGGISSTSYATSRFVMDDNVLSLDNLSAYYRFSNALNKRLGVENTVVTFYMADVFWLSSITRERGLNYPYAKNFSIQIRTSF